MKEREEIRVQIPLFDEIPQGLKPKQALLVKEVFDGSIGTRGITLILDPATGDPMHARFIDLLTGKVVSYEPLARGRWTNPIGDLREESQEFQKLERVYEDVRLKYELWKYTPDRGSFPMREWTTGKTKIQQCKPSIQPQDWYKRIINPFDEAVPPTQDNPKPRGINYRRPSRRKTGPVIRSAIIPSKDGPRLKVAKPAPANLKRSVDREVRSLSRRGEAR